MNSLISVIVPVYNARKYLVKCLDSIIGQTYENLEIILVDDGSTDGCAGICDEYAGRDNRIRVVHQENRGAAAARNTGLDICTGELLLFADSDDYISESCIEKLASALNEHNADMSICRFNTVYPVPGKKDIIKPEPVNREVVSALPMPAAEGLCHMLRQHMFDVSACGKLFRRSCFEGVRFPEGHICEDLGTIHMTFIKSCKVVFIPDPMVFYVQNPESVSHTDNRVSAKCIKDELKMADKMYGEVAKYCPKAAPAADCRRLSAYFQAFIFAAAAGETELSLHIWEFIRKRRMPVLADSKARPKTRAAALLSFFGMKAFILTSNIIRK